jgi:hypothetical protein
METQTKKTPETLSEMARAIATLAEQVERIAAAGTKSTALLVDRMEADGPDEYVAAFHGLTYAWILAVMPEVEDVMHFDAKDYHRTVVLQRYSGSVREGTYERYRVEFMLPQSLAYVDDEWAGREVEE